MKVKIAVFVANRGLVGGISAPEFLTHPRLPIMDKAEEEFAEIVSGENHETFPLNLSLRFGIQQPPLQHENNQQQHQIRRDFNSLLTDCLEFRRLHHTACIVSESKVRRKGRLCYGSDPQRYSRASIGIPSSLCSVDFRFVLIEESQLVLEETIT